MNNQGVTGRTNTNNWADYADNDAVPTPPWITETRTTPKKLNPEAQAYNPHNRSIQVPTLYQAFIRKLATRIVESLVPPKHPGTPNPETITLTSRQATSQIIYAQLYTLTCGFDYPALWHACKSLTNTLIGIAESDAIYARFLTKVAIEGILNSMSLLTAEGDANKLELLLSEVNIILKKIPYLLDPICRNIIILFIANRYTSFACDVRLQELALKTFTSLLELEDLDLINLNMAKSIIAQLRRENPNNFDFAPVDLALKAAEEWVNKRLPTRSSSSIPVAVRTEIQWPSVRSQPVINRAVDAAPGKATISNKSNHLSLLLQSSLNESDTKICLSKLRANDVTAKQFIRETKNGGHKNYDSKLLLRIIETLIKHRYSEKWHTDKLMYVHSLLTKIMTGHITSEEGNQVAIIRNFECLRDTTKLIHKKDSTLFPEVPLAKHTSKENALEAIRKYLHSATRLPGEHIGRIEAIKREICML